MATSTTVRQDAPAGNRREKKGPVTKVGNLTKDPELRTNDKGTWICEARIAVESPKTPGDWAGERETSYYDVVLFGTLAEHFAVSVGKGTRVVVTGDAEVEHWEGRDGTEHTTKRILASAAGPDLRWATASVAKANKASEAAPEATGPALDYAGDEEPF